MDVPLIPQNKVLNIWPISLVGLPILSLFLIILFGMFGSIYVNQLTYFLSISGAFVFALFSITNLVFNFYTIYTFWPQLSGKNRVLYLFIGLIANIAGSYILAKLWKKQGINMLSIGDKKSLNTLSFVFYFFLTVSIILPAFIASRQF